MNKIYEIVDSSDEEMYFTIGLFLSLDEAINEVEKAGADLCDNLDEVAIVRIQERDVGRAEWSSVGKTVYERQWTQNYETDSWDVSLTLDSRTETTLNEEREAK